MTKLRDEVTRLLQDTCSKLRSLICESTIRSESETVSLSGGLDSSILVSCVTQPKPRAYTVVARDFSSTDLVNAQLVAKLAGLELEVISVGIDELLEAVERTVEVLGVFNPIEIRNNVVAYIAMRKAKHDGFRSIMCGDGADELFAGYGFFKRIPTDSLRLDLERIWSVMHFPSLSIAKSMGMRLHAPYLDANVVEFAKSMSPELLIRDENGIKYGKWILRKAFEKSLPLSIVWREKMAMQDGSGTSGLTKFFDNTIPDFLFTDKAGKYRKEDQVILQSKEALHYYEAYRKYFDPPSKSNSSKNVCPNCGYSVLEGSRFCRMCGSFPI